MSIQQYGPSHIYHNSYASRSHVGFIACLSHALRLGPNVHHFSINLQWVKQLSNLTCHPCFAFFLIPRAWKCLKYLLVLITEAKSGTFYTPHLAFTVKKKKSNRNCNIAVDTCSIKRYRWPLLAFIKRQVCFKKWEWWVSSGFLISGWRNFQNLKVYQVNREDKCTTLNHNKGLQGPPQHFTPMSSWTHIPPRAYVSIGLVRWPKSVLLRIRCESASLEEPSSFTMEWDNIWKTSYPGQFFLWLNTFQMIHQSLYKTKSLKTTIHGWC